MTWRNLKESGPPVGADVILLHPAEGAEDVPHVYFAWVAANGMVQFALPWDQACDYTRKENEEWMARLLAMCTHWAPIWDVIQPPTSTPATTKGTT